jgi:hypothetical protein
MNFKRDNTNDRQSLPHKTMHNKIIQDLFIKNFVPKDQWERAAYLLNDPKKRKKFTDRLNHQWDKALDTRFISKIPSGANDFEFTKNELKIKENELCYVISNYDDIDEQLIGFAEAFEKIYGRGFGSLIINSTADKLYLETELVQGKQNRFIGKR